ncbi:MAG: hypothetical protein ACP5IL_15265 [Syntrophobacteraceae bacterium]
MNQTGRTESHKRGQLLRLGPVHIEHLPELAATGVVLAASGISPLMFVAQAAGYGSMNFYATFVLLPAVFAVVLIAIIARIQHWQRLYSGIAVAVVAGPLAAAGLDIVRAVGFRGFHAMPGSMPMLMGVLILNRTMLGPDVWSNIVGWGDHILINGISFALVYVLVFGRPRWWLGLPYAWIIATIFMVSPDMTMLGDIGYFGHDIGPGFAITVYAAHTVFGLILGVIVARRSGVKEPLWRRHMKMSGGEG